jgi:hypothetical protein
MMQSKIVILDDVPPDIAFAAARIARKQAGTVVDGGNPRTQGTLLERLHLVHHLHQKKQLPVARTRGGICLLFLPPIIGQRDLKTRVDDVFAVLDVFLFRAPRLAIRRIAEHKVKGFARKFVGAERGADTDVFGVVALDHHVAFADGVGLVVDFLAKEIDVALGAISPSSSFTKFWDSVSMPPEPQAGS